MHSTFVFANAVNSQNFLSFFFSLDIKDENSQRADVDHMRTYSKEKDHQWVDTKKEDN